MSVEVTEQNITVRTDPGQFDTVVERYKSNGWTESGKGPGWVVLENPAMTGYVVQLRDQGASL